MPVDLLPLPESEQSELLNAVKDIMHNGGRIPQDVSNELIMAAILELNGCVVRNANQSRRNALGMRWITGGLLIVAAALVFTHSSELSFLTDILKFFVP